MLEAFIDGACEPINPGGTAGYGIVVKSSGVIIFKKSGVVGSGKKMSNNVGEYSALLELLHWYISENRKETITVYSDSQLVINQMKGFWGVHKGFYLPYYEKVTDLFTQEIFERFKFLWIPREKNWEADKLSKSALTAQGVRITER